jgi:purine-binding chemotaxis protein CheW
MARKPRLGFDPLSEAAPRAPGKKGEDNNSRGVGVDALIRDTSREGIPPSPKPSVKRSGEASGVDALIRKTSPETPAGPPGYGPEEMPQAGPSSAGLDIQCHAPLRPAEIIDDRADAYEAPGPEGPPLEPSTNARPAAGYAHQKPGGADDIRRGEDSETEGESSQYLSFTLAQELCMFEIENVREVIGFSRITRLPNMPDYMSGVINLRGGAVPVVDLNLKLLGNATKPGIDTCIVILDVQTESGCNMMGLVVDSVREVTTLEDSELQPPPKIGNHLKVDYLRAIGRKGEDLILIFDVTRLFSDWELQSLGARRR